MQQAPIVTLILGLITAIITAITLIATKENKVSESRQSWINGQRADVVAAVATAQGFYAAPDTEGRARWLAEFHAALDRIGPMLATRRINHVVLSEATTVIESAARVPLKRHGERVRAGERGFRIFKAVFQACLGFLAAVGVFLVFQSSRAAPPCRKRPVIAVKR